MKKTLRGFQGHEVDAIAYQCAPSVRWAVEMYGIFLINEHTGRSGFLGYPQAALWDLMTRNYSYAQTLRVFQAITSLQVNDAERLIMETLEEWTRSGFLTMVTHHGESFDHK